MTDRYLPDAKEKPGVEIIPGQAATLEDIAKALNDVYTPAGVLMFWSARITYLDGRRPCDIWAERDMPMLERLAQHVNALADGAFG